MKNLNKKLIKGTGKRNRYIKKRTKKNSKGGGGVNTYISKLNDIYIRPGVHSGKLGLIAIRDIPSDTPICNCQPHNFMTINMDSLNRYNVPTSVRKTIHELFDGYNEENNTCTIPKDFDTSISLISFINHNDHPNCHYNLETHTINTNRKIDEGEEVCVNYKLYQSPGSYTYRHAELGFKDEPSI